MEPGRLRSQTQDSGSRAVQGRHSFFCPLPGMSGFELLWGRRKGKLRGSGKSEAHVFWLLEIIVRWKPEVEQE